MNQRVQYSLDSSPDGLTRLRDSLVQGENLHRAHDHVGCFKTYAAVARDFENLNDFETASYFYNRCLEVSNEFKYFEGQARAFRGLGICEEKVYNKFEAKENLETANEKAIEG